jgi:hypothetical protein
MTDSEHAHGVRDIANLFGLCALAYTGRTVHLVASFRRPHPTTDVELPGRRLGR